MTRKVLALALAVMMVVGLFAGCNTNSGASTTTASTTKAAGTTAAGTTAATTTAAPEETPLLNDLGVLPLVNEEITLTVGLADLGNIEGDLSKHVHWTHMQEQSGIKLEYTWYPSEEMNTKIDLAIAAGGKDLPNILMRDNGWLGASANAWGYDGFVVDIAPYLEENTYWSPIAVNNSMSGNWEDTIAKSSTAEGALYGFPSWRESLPASGYNSLVLKGSWAAKAGLVEGGYDPEKDYVSYTYDENGEYITTWDQALGYFEWVKTSDPNGNGKNDEIPVSTDSTSSMRNLKRMVFPNFMGRSSTFGVGAVIDGVIEYHYTRDEYRDAVSFIHNKLYETGYLDPLSFTQDTTSLQATANLEEQILGATFSMYNYFTLRDESGKEILNSKGLAMDDSLETYGLEVEAGSGNRWIGAQVGWAEKNAIITWTCENIEAAVRLLDLWGSEENTMRAAIGREGYEWAYASDMPEEIGANLISPWGFTDQEPIYRFTREEVEGGAEYAKNSVGIVTPNILTLNGMGVYNATYKTSVYVGQPKEMVEQYKDQYLRRLYYETFDIDEVLTAAIYTNEETEENTELKAPIDTYVNECFVAFCMGEMDIDGADWDKYLAELEKMGLSDYMENVQNAYERANEIMGK